VLLHTIAIGEVRRTSQLVSWAAAPVFALTLSACGGDAPPPEVVRPVQVTVVRYGGASETVSLTGQIQARNQVNLAFRVGGRLIERRVDVGGRVSPGQLVARLEAQDARNSLLTAEAELAAARASLVQSQNNERRYQSLVSTGVISRAQYDEAQQQLAAAQSRVASASAALQTSRDNLKRTELYSDAAGVVTSKGAEPGEVVQAGQTIVQIAQSGSKDGVFNVPAALMRDPAHLPASVTVALADAPGIAVTGQIREVAPEADPVTRTYLIKVTLDNPSAAMRLGATAIGTATFAPRAAVSIPATSLVQLEGKPAVWVVDPRSMQVELRAVTIDRYETSAVIIASGLKDGDTVVTAGVHALRPHQAVKLLEPTG
jgi:membrane fusion protein, multidrug efflux system